MHIFLVISTALSGAAALLRSRPFGSSFGIPGQNASFEYIVIGGGNAGLTIATRLAEQQTGRVAVIEAGSFYEISNGNLSEIPAFDCAHASKAQDDWHPLIDWGYMTSAQKAADHVELHYPRGKCLGGSSARNYMLYQRGTESSYRLWAEMVGDESYSFSHLLPFFTKSLRFTPPNAELRFANTTPVYDVTTLGDANGFLSVTYPNYAQAFASWASRGLLDMGMRIISGFQSGALIGQSYALFTIDSRTMTRESSETAFLRRALDYSNHVVYPMTMAKRILFDEHKTATGVQVDTQGMSYILTATKEVIVSAGVFGSPQLLMVSGIGPSSTLRELDISVIADLPGVGQNMQDHVYFGPSYRVNAHTMSSLQNPAFRFAAEKEFQESATGMLSNPSTDVLGWEKLPVALRSSLSAKAKEALDSYPADWPEVEYLAISAYLGYQNRSGGSDPNDSFNYATLGAALAAPLSRGNLTITSADNSIHPIINPNYFTDPVDMEVSIAAYKRLRQFWSSKALEGFVIGDEAFPGRQVSSDTDIADLIKKSFHTVFHAACTCAMGKENDPMAVVDSRARVYGVNGLRIVDASIFPLLPPGHPMATVYALAEKIAADISTAQSDTPQKSEPKHDEL